MSFRAYPFHVYCALMADKRQRIVVKFGSGILSKPTRDGLHVSQIRRLTSEVAELTSSGYQCVVVSSGAVAAGMMQFGIHERPADLPSIQACAAVGQSRLMRLYETLFSRHGLRVAQLLLTHQDLDSRMRYENARNTLERLFQFGGVIPVINENDSVAVEELNFGDNDMLSAEVAMLCRATLLVILTSVDGLLANDGTRIAEVNDIESVRSLATREGGVYSRGGMISKLEAANFARQAGIPAVIGSGLYCEQSKENLWAPVLRCNSEARR
jgi:glutamate 5-kinase